MMKVKVDYRCNEESEDLRQKQPAYYRNAKRVPRFAARAAADRNRNRAKQGGHGGHHDWTKALQATLHHGCLGVQAFNLLRVKREIDNHDCVLLDNANEQDHSQKRIEIQVFTK